MDGLIVLNKPAGITSAKALYRLRAACGQKKSGHSGTLDRLADGVLVICLGRATKLVESIMDLRKRYRATARLDVTSRSLDSDTPLEPVAVRGFPSAEAVWSALAAFQGETLQRPPAVSALKIGGTPSYRLVARGREVELKPRRVRIYSVTPIAYEWPIVSFEVLCGRGTYIRSLVRDLGGGSTPAAASHR